MAFTSKTRAAALSAVCAAALFAAGTFAVRAQDPAPEASQSGAQPAPPAPAEGAAPAAAPPEPAAPAAAAPAATPEPDPAAVVARAGDREITEQDLRIARQEFGSELAQV